MTKPCLHCGAQFYPNTARDITSRCRRCAAAMLAEAPCYFCGRQIVEYMACALITEYLEQLDKELDKPRRASMSPPVPHDATYTVWTNGWVLRWRWAGDQPAQLENRPWIPTFRVNDLGNRVHVFCPCNGHGMEPQGMGDGQSIVMQCPACQTALQVWRPEIG